MTANLSLRESGMNSPGKIIAPQRRRERRRWIGTVIIDPLPSVTGGPLAASYWQNTPLASCIEPWALPEAFSCAAVRTVRPGGQHQAIRREPQPLDLLGRHLDHSIGQPLPTGAHECQEAGDVDAAVPGRIR